MSTDFHTEFGIEDDVNISAINSRLAELDAAITSQAAASVSMQAAVLYESQTSGTNGGGASATTWQTRTLNTELDDDEIVTLSSNQFTPIAGTYVIMAAAPAYKVDEHRLRLYNVTQASVVQEGGNAFSDNGDAYVTNALLYWIFTANGTDAYRIEHYTNTAQASTGLGLNVNDGSAEVYTSVMLLRFA